MTEKEWGKVSLDQVYVGDTIRYTREGANFKIVATGAVEHDWIAEGLCIRLDGTVAGMVYLADATKLERIEPVTPPLPTKPGSVIIVDEVRLHDDGPLARITLPALGEKEESGHWIIDGVRVRDICITAWRPAVVMPTELTSEMMEAAGRAVAICDGKLPYMWDDDEIESYQKELYREHAEDIYEAIMKNVKNDTE